MVSLSKLRELHLSARKVRNEVESDLWGYLIGECTRNDKNPSDLDVLRVLEKFVGSMSVVDERSRLEVDVVRGLLPQKMTGDEISAVLVGLRDAGVVSLGMVMKYFKENHGGSYDGSLVSSLAKGMEFGK